MLVKHVVPWAVLNRGGYLFYWIAAALLVVILVSLDGQWSARPLEARPVVCVGLISYGFYIWLSFVVAAVSFRFIEQPSAGCRHGSRWSRFEAVTKRRVSTLGRDPTTRWVEGA